MRAASSCLRKVPSFTVDMIVKTVPLDIRYQSGPGLWCIIYYLNKHLLKSHDAPIVSRRQEGYSHKRGQPDVGREHRNLRV